MTTTGLTAEYDTHRGPQPASPLDFVLPSTLEARVPPEVRGVPRDRVGLLVSAGDGSRLAHATFDRLPDFLVAGDLLVVNDSATLPAALTARREDGRVLRIHLSTAVPPTDLDPFVGEGPATDPAEWRVVEPRDARVAAGERVALPGGASLRLVLPYRGSPRLWIARLDLPATARDGDASPAGTNLQPLREARPSRPADAWAMHASPARWSPAGSGEACLDHAATCSTLAMPAVDGGASARLRAYLTRWGHPIAYSYVSREWPIEAYQTVYAVEPGSSEMPSAGRPFSDALIAELRRRGVGLASLTLHTGVSSLETGERPYPEWFRLPAATAEAVNRTRAAGRRVIAVGTTVVRALASASDAADRVRPVTAWTDRVVGPDDRAAVVDGLITGFHEPRASHLDLLAAIAGRAHLARAYAAALDGAYLWHEFGDAHLILREVPEPFAP